MYVVDWLSSLLHSRNQIHCKPNYFHMKRALLPRRQTIAKKAFLTLKHYICIDIYFTSSWWDVSFLKPRHYTPKSVFTSLPLAEKVIIFFTVYVLLWVAAIQVKSKSSIIKFKCKDYIYLNRSRNRKQHQARQYTPKTWQYTCHTIKRVLCRI